MNDIIFWSGIWNYRYPEYIRPIAPYELSHWLRNNKFRCQVIEFVQHMTADQIVELTELAIGKNTFAIAMSTTFWPLDGTTIGVKGIIPSNIQQAMTIIKERYPSVEFIAGGHRTVRYKDHFDRVFDTIETDGENQILNYCNEKKYKIRFPSKIFNIVELNHRFVEQDIILPHESLPIEMGRGCIFKCKFCSYLNIGKKKHTYQRQFDHVLEEFAYNQDMFGTKNYMILDDTVNEDIEKMTFLSSIPKKINSDFTWNGFLRADLVWAHKNYNALFDSGLRNVFFGFESLHPKTSKIIGKGWMGTHAKDWIPHLYNNLWNKQVSIEASFIIGLPYETEFDILNTVNWANEVDIGTVMFFPFNLRNNFEDGAPVSEFTRDYKKYNYTIDNEDDWVNLDTGISKQSAIKLATDMNSLVIDKWRVSGWRSNTYYNLGKEIDEIRNISVKDGNSFLLRSKDQFILRYIKLYKDYYSRL
jgi:radical SAM superfamily enzyme YgiQ (UPF0313 family)